MIKIIQLNAWQGRLARGLMSYIEKEKADIICLQEVFNGDFEVPCPDRMFDIGRRLKEASGLEYEYFSKRFTLDVANGTLPYGNVILSRFPFMQTKTIQTENKIVEHINKDNYLNNATNLQIVQIEVDGQVLTIANHHGHHELDPLGNADSVEAMSKVANELRSVSGPLILCGDLNVIYESEAMRVFDGWMKSLPVEYGAKSTLTGLNIKRDVVCDHILVNDKVVVENFKVDDAVVSDHCPLVAQIGVN